jgi:hypothetical protein
MGWIMPKNYCPFKHSRGKTESLIVYLPAKYHFPHKLEPFLFLTFHHAWNTIWPTSGKVTLFGVGHIVRKKNKRGEMITINDNFK